MTTTSTEQVRRWRAENPRRALGHQLAAYGITVDDYEAMLARQGGRCAVCRTHDPGKRRWHVDHDHACCPGTKSCGSCVRGLLCANCNTALGKVKDDPAILLRMVDYLTSA